MPLQITTGAGLVCTFGMVPSVLNATPSTVLVGGPMGATVMDYVPGMNIPPFGMCSCMANPAVAAATAAALGVLTPMPCMPMTFAPWVPGQPAVLLAGKPALTDASVLNCSWGGVIRIVAPSQFQVVLG